jgi:hypothetical protein
LQPGTTTAEFCEPCVETDSARQNAGVVVSGGYDRIPLRIETRYLCAS